MPDKIVIVGGIPDPIGGVTTFIRRVIRREKCVSHLFDLYPSSHKVLPPEFSGKYICNTSKILTVANLFLFCLISRGYTFHFNFSTPKSLFLLLFLPKINSKWLVTFHHGDLGQRLPFWLRMIASRKLDCLLSLSPRQEEWYKINFPKNKIVASSSYVKPSKPMPPDSFKNEISTIKNKYRRVLVCSGFPRKIYNHLLAINLMKYYAEDVLICCLYGSGELIDEIKEKSAELSNVILYDELNEDSFNYLLSSSDLYLRLTSEDSFGVAVADAINLGAMVISTNVCPRYKGAVLTPELGSDEELKLIVNEVFNEKAILSISDTEIAEFSYSIIH